MFLRQKVIMNLKQSLTEKKPAILKAWSDAALEVPPDRSPDFLKKQNALAADTGCSLAEGMEGLFNALLLGVMHNDVSRFLDDMMRIRVADDFTAAEALGFILGVKRIVRKELGNIPFEDAQMAEELAVWEAVVDDMVLFAFDIYAKSRESVLAFKASEAKKETFRLLKKAKLIDDDQE